MRKQIGLILGIFAAFAVQAQTTYKININKPENEILRGHLDLGGSNPAGEEISVNSYFIEKDSKPFFPVVGEFHYARFPEEYWEEEILKMKAGGINVIATYVFWNLHERQEGSFDWTGDLNLRKFVELTQKHKMYAIVRMGPFCHGEMRNGGIPDWLYGRAFEIRSNDPEYLAYVDILYGQIANQIEGLLFKDGGPVIGIQLENEYQHSAAPWEFDYPGSKDELTVADRDAALAHEQIAVTDGNNPWSEYGKEHMANLKAIVKKHGIDVPLYTATGWGNATIVEKGSIPVTAGYAYPFWADPSPSGFYLFKDIKHNPDYSPVSYDTELYPSISAEIGPGIQPKFSRRPIVPFESVNPLMVRIIGSGSNGIGYYMYHGGSTPAFDGKFYNEEVNGIPRVNYDFQAPIGQYGQVRYHFKHLRMLHQFLEVYGAKLAPMKTVLPETNAAISPNDSETLRYAVRSYGDSGFLFLINFQDHVDVKDIEEVNVEVVTNNETISFPANGSFNVPKAASAILPFNLDLGNTTLKSATVQPLTVLHGNNDYFLFSAIKGIEAELNFAPEARISKLQNAQVSKVGGMKSVTSKSDAPFSFTVNDVKILVLPHELAINAVKIGEELYVSEALILEDNNNLGFISRKENNRMHVFPERKRDFTLSNGNIKEEKTVFAGFNSYSITFKRIEPEISFEKVSPRKYTMQLNSDISLLNDVFVEADYVGDRALAFIDGKLITDHLYQERKWEIGLKNIATQLQDKKMVLIFHPMYSDYEYLKDLKNIPEFEDGKYLKIKGFKVVPEYKTTITYL
ncbi:beta-galactosidase [Draconibacterium sp. IB214405]|uniref:beta-galactosidase n=1 Tax=Draconibacterium sp. IB214405 TaxID=3097352 RepID=UPI002A166278|nr:beta-galactosidase [Draconibacterium sp. IB214405]MDX8339371.1 beta-galactosidase [Draconibacterium sp. IB214405]